MLINQQCHQVDSTLVEKGFELKFRGAMLWVLRTAVSDISYLYVRVRHCKENAWFLDGAGDRLFLSVCQSDNANQIMQT